MEFHDTECACAYCDLEREETSARRGRMANLALAAAVLIVLGYVLCLAL